MTDANEHSRINRREFVKQAGAVGSASLVFGVDRGAAQEDPSYGPRTAATVREDVTKPTAVREFFLIDPTSGSDETVVDSQRWRTVKGTGNCCENYLAAAPDGRLFDMGGDYLRVSPDYGQTWHEVGPSTPYPATSEGCVSAAPGGDICAVDWNPYSPDRVISYKYVAEEEIWYYMEVPLNMPFYDRPWFVVVPGPFEVGSETVPYITIMRGGWPISKVLYISLDGLNYQLASSRQVDALVQGSRQRFLTDVGDTAQPGILDWVQPHTETGITPLGDGQALGDSSLVHADVDTDAGVGSVGCNHAILNPDNGTAPASDLQWACFDTPSGLPEGRMQTDANGTVHQVEFETVDQFVYRVSQDGGHTWTRHRFTLPGGYTIAGGALSRFDVKVRTAENLRGEDRDLMVLAVHGSRESEPAGGEPPGPIEEVEREIEKHAPEHPGEEEEDPSEPDDQDLLYKFWNPTSADPMVELHYVGSNHLSYISGVSTEERFDFSTVSILPDGRVAVSFADRADINPMVAVEAPGAADAYFFEVVGERNDEASVYTGGQTARLAFSVEPGWVPDDHHTAAVRDRIPSDWHVYGEGEDESFGEANQEVERVEIDGEGGKLVYLTEAAVHGEEADYRYFARVPDDPAATGTYTVGPVQVQPDNPDQIATVDVGQWMDVPGTTEDDIVIGQGT